MALCGSCHCPRMIVTTLCAWCTDHHSHSQQGWVPLYPSHPGVPTVPHITGGQRKPLTKETPSALGKAIAGYVSGCAEDLAGVCPVIYREEGHWACWVGAAPTAPNTVASNTRCRGAMISSKCSNLVVNQASKAPENFLGDIPFKLKSEPHSSEAWPWAWATGMCPPSCFDDF